MKERDKYIYIITTDDGKYMKVGRSDDLIKRMSTIQSNLNNNPYIKEKIYLNLFYYTKIRYPLRFETNVHNILKQEGPHIIGEWFINQIEERDKLIEKLKNLDRRYVR